MKPLLERKIETDIHPVNAEGIRHESAANVFVNPDHPHRIESSRVKEVAPVTVDPQINVAALEQKETAAQAGGSFRFLGDSQEALIANMLPYVDGQRGNVDPFDTVTALEDLQKDL